MTKNPWPILYSNISYHMIWAKSSLTDSITDLPSYIRAMLTPDEFLQLICKYLYGVVGGGGYNAEMSLIYTDD